VVLSSDEEVFGGYRNVTKDSDVTFTTTAGSHDNRPNWFQVYAPSRTVVVYAPSDFADKDADRKPHGIPGLGIQGLGPYYSR
jgi:1,4-alpha-glucan branching enzyme